LSLKTNRKHHSVQKKRSSLLPRILIIIWLLVIVVAILLVKKAPLDEILVGAGVIPLKQKATEIPHVGNPEYTLEIDFEQIVAKPQTPEYSQTPEVSRPSEIFQTPEPTQTIENAQEEVTTITPEYYQANVSPAEQYKYAIANGKPTLVFFHSNTCKSCLQMIDTVNEVYPEFFHQVVLIDVNVYDSQNEGLINRVGINFIPTLVFYNQNGDSLFSIGVISSEELRQKFNEITQGKIP